MSLCRPQKAELIAIYRLEFYKKQKNWKFSSSYREKKLPQKPDNKLNLNVTYNVDHTDSEEQSNPLNVAFVDSDSDQTLQTKPSKIPCNYKTKELSLEWQEPVNIWPDPESWDAQSVIKEHTRNDNLQKNNFAPKTCTQKRLEDLQKAAISERTDQQNIGSIKYYPDSLELNDKWVGENAYNRNEENDWQIETGQDAWTQVPQTDAVDGMECVEDVINSELGLIGDTPWSEFPVQHAADWSVDSESEFQRGAHAAPHSSENELSSSPCVGAEASLSSLSRLSSAQLMQAAHLHLRELRRVLQESELRKKLRNAASLNSFSGNSFEEYPTRDVGPHSCNNNSTFNSNVFKDVFITGSYKNVGGEGRGRGRGRVADAPLWR